MNIQSERLENHRAQLTVEIDEARWEKAKKTAAKQLSKRFNIPGFRKGKAPYHIIVKNIGEAPIIEQAMETLGNQVYSDALDESGVKPYTSGTLEDFKLEPQPTYIFSVPLQPEVELGDYRSVRLDYEAPEITDEDVDRAMRQLQKQEAVVEDAEGAAVAGQRVTIDIHSRFVDGPERPEDEDDEEDDVVYQGDGFVHQHEYELDLNPDEDDPILPGFIDALIGAEAGDEKTFELTVPEDEDEYEGIGGRKVEFTVSVEKVENVTLPELNDDFAARLTDEEDEPLSLLELRARVRENMEKEAQQNADDAYANQVLDKIIEGASVSMPVEMIVDRAEDMLGDLDRQLRQQGMNLETYLNVTGTERSALIERYKPDAEKSVVRTLVLTEILNAEELSVSDAEIDARIDQMLEQFGDQKDVFRQFMDTPEQRQSIGSSLLYEAGMAHLAKIGKGEPLDKVTEAATDETEEAAAAEEASAESDADESDASEETDEAKVTEDVSSDTAGEASSDDDTEE